MEMQWMSFVFTFTISCCTMMEVSSLGICPELDNSPVNLDLALAKGNWYLYAWIPTQWSRCHNYTILEENNGTFTLQETYISAIWNKPATSNYNVKYEVESNELKLTSMIINIIPETVSWKVVKVIYDDFLLLYRCNMISEESQLWVRNSELSIDLENTPKVMVEAMAKLNLKPADYSLKRDSHCARDSD